VTLLLTLVISAAALAPITILLLVLYRRLAVSLHQVKRQAATLAEQAKLLDLAHDAILVWDLKTGAIRFWNRGSEELYGWSSEDVLGRTPQAVLQTHFPRPLAEINAELIRTRHWEGELIHTRRDGTSVVVASRWALQTDDDGQPRAVLGINSDITSRKDAEAALEHQALHDSLTGLPNRTLFRDRLERALAIADRHDRSVAVLFLDLDNFKIINDSLGHQAGDSLLVEVAQRLRDCLRTSDTVARLGGDEFTLLLAEISHEAEAQIVAERIGRALRQPVRIGERDVFVSASIGVALSVPRRTHVDGLLRNADVAMYRSKAAGKARHSMFDAEMNRLAMDRLELETDLRQALANGEFKIYYQPIHTLADGRLTEVEALLRWDRPGHGLMSPAAFIPLAEETGLVVPIGRWVINEACRQARAWNTAYRSELIMSVNLSARQFQDPALLSDIEAAIAETGLDPRNLRLEVTETVAMHDVEATVSKLQALKGLGIQLAIDDFGTGYSSLGYLKRFPVDSLKIDRSFIEGLGVDVQDTAIVQSVVALAKVLRLTVVGEGIENAAQAAHLEAIGCEHGQGYLFARPQPAESLALLLGESAFDYVLNAA
jgi:diguanylate cyclase (GGDEF)-like protein/PAS domain S-box-containing protein